MFLPFYSRDFVFPLEITIISFTDQKTGWVFAEVNYLFVLLAYSIVSKCLLTNTFLVCLKKKVFETISFLCKYNNVSQCFHGILQFKKSCFLYAYSHLYAFQKEKCKFQPITLRKPRHLRHFLFEFFFNLKNVMFESFEQLCSHNFYSYSKKTAFHKKFKIFIHTLFRLLKVLSNHCISPSKRLKSKKCYFC